MSFSLGFDELPNSSYQSGANDYHVNSVSGVASSAGEDSYSTAFSPNASTSISNDLKSMLESNKEGLKVRRGVALIHSLSNAVLLSSL